MVRVGDHVILNCTYTANGSATVGNMDHTVYSAEFSRKFDSWGDVKLVADGFVCVDCYEDDQAVQSLKKIDPTDDYEYRQKHTAYVLKSKLNIPLSVIQHQIMPYLQNCVEHKDRYDCLLCPVILASDYTLEKEGELRLESEEEEEEHKSKRPRLSSE